MTDTDQEWKRWILGLVFPILGVFEGVKGLILKTTTLSSHQARYVVFVRKPSLSRAATSRRPSFSTLTSSGKIASGWQAIAS